VVQGKKEVQVPPGKDRKGVVTGRKVNESQIYLGDSVGEN
jgi:hypothetical protein